MKGENIKQQSHSLLIFDMLEIYFMYSSLKLTGFVVLLTFWSFLKFFLFFETTYPYFCLQQTDLR